MANPYLVLGGVVVGIITAGFGMLMVPGWIESAQDAAVRSDLAQVAIVQAAAAAGPGTLSIAEIERGDATRKLGLNVNASEGVMLCITRDMDREHWAAVAISQSGTFFARVDESNTGEGVDQASALAAAGGLVAGVDAPILPDGTCAPSPDPDLVAPLGPLTTMTQYNALASGRFGTYLVNERGQLVRISDIGKPHLVEGPIAGKNLKRQGGIAIDAAGSIYVTDRSTPANIFKVSVDGTYEAIRDTANPASVVWISAGLDGKIYYSTGTRFYAVENGVPVNKGDANRSVMVSQFAVDASSNIWFTDNNILYMKPSGANSSTEQLQSRRDINSNSLGSFGGLAFNSDGVLFLSDPSTCRINKFVSVRVVIPVVNPTGGCNNPANTNLNMGAIQNIAIDGSDYIYIMDTVNSAVRMVERDGRASTYAKN